MKKSTILFIGAAVIFVLGIIVETIGFATASTEAELIARSQNSDFLWIVFAAVATVISGLIVRKNES